VSLIIPKVDPSPIAGLSFFDDFVGAAYDNQVWSLAAGATAVSQNSLDGRVLVSGASGQMYLGNIGVFSAANNAKIRWRGTLTPGSGSAECGLADNNSSTDWIAWLNGGANFRCQCGIGGGSTSDIDSGVAGDTSNHLFEIVLSTGIAQFFLDGVYRTTIVTNVTAHPLQPYIWLAGTGSANMDFVLIQGDR
jgi:hypothetical protein